MKPTFFALISIVLLSCTGTKKSSLWTKKYCKLERLEYQEITDTVRVTKNGDVKAGVIANGKVILTDKISIDSIGAYLEGGNKVFIDQKTFKTVKVSPAFYEELTRKRTALCDIVQGVKDGTIESDTGKARAEKLYLDIITLYSGLKTDEEKKT